MYDWLRSLILEVDPEISEYDIHKLIHKYIDFWRRAKCLT